MKGKIHAVIIIILLVSLSVGNLAGIAASTELNPEEINWEGIFIQYYKNHEIRLIPELGIYTIEEEYDWYSDSMSSIKEIIDFGEKGLLDDQRAWEYAETDSYKGHYINRYWITGTFEGETHTRSVWCSPEEDIGICCTDESTIKKLIDLLATPTPTHSPPVTPTPRPTPTPTPTPRPYLSSTPPPATPRPTPQLEKDSDGDGVPDEYDYAPYDPKVQTKGDVKSPGFGAIFALAELLTVVYLLRRRK